MTQPLHFCGLVIGNMGRTGELSLESISALGDVKYCLMADSYGFEWYDNVVRERNLQLKLCRHPISENYSWVLGDTTSSSKYSNFGERRFFRLMHLKWQVLIESISESKEIGWVTFSDLDVFWKSSPSFEASKLQNQEKSFAIQKDFAKERIFYCPGIMIWNKDMLALDVLHEIQTFHEKLIKEDETIPDDKAINRWLIMNDNISRMFELDEYKFVIGHRILFLLLGQKKYKLKNLIAFHANYANGIDVKFRNLQTVSRLAKRDIRWTVGFLEIFFETAVRKMLDFRISKKS